MFCVMASQAIVVPVTEWPKFRLVSMNLYNSNDMPLTEMNKRDKHCV
jgi:hypothetical protein